MKSRLFVLRLLRSQTKCRGVSRVIIDGSELLSAGKCQSNKITELWKLDGLCFLIYGTVLTSSPSPLPPWCLDQSETSRGIPSHVLGCELIKWKARWSVLNSGRDYVSSNFHSKSKQMHATSSSSFSRPVFSKYVH